jgi:hypothetical protein
MMHVEAAENGLGCDCICFVCKKPLVARQGLKNGGKNDNHFAHPGGSECPWAGETALHKLAKGIVAEPGFILLPGNRRFSYDTAIKEKPIGDIVADVWVTDGASELVVEIFVCHAVTPSKEQKILQQGLTALEIDISEVPRDISRKDLTTILIDQIHRKRMIQPATKPVMLREKEKTDWVAIIGGIAAVIAAVFFIDRFILRRIRKSFRF